MLYLLKDGVKERYHFAGEQLIRLRVSALEAKDQRGIDNLHSDTKLLLAKNSSERILFEQFRASRVVSGESLSFPEILRVRNLSEITKNNSQELIS